MMAFFDKISETLSKGSKNIIDKTKDLTDIAKLNGQISSEENKIRDAYIALGKAYYKKYRNHPDASEAVQFETIANAEIAIAKYKTEIQAIRKVTICHNCGAEIASDALFCPKCGAKKGSVKEEEVKTAEQENNPSVCPRCGAELEEGTAFCQACGEQIEEQQEETEKE